MTIYNLFDLGMHLSYLWTVDRRDDDEAKEKAQGLLRGENGVLSTGPTGVDKMECIGLIWKRVVAPVKPAPPTGTVRLESERP